MPSLLFFHFIRRYRDRGSRLRGTASGNMGRRCRAETSMRAAIAAMLVATAAGGLAAPARIAADCGQRLCQ